MNNTTWHINSLLLSLDPAVRRIGLRRDDVVAENWVLHDGHWPVYSVFRSAAGKNLSIGLNIMRINQWLID